ncbi:hypothetical protein DBR43_17120 [Pedobacter sp. KBW06]|nr:hypothetical protein DBR43_17120 [Pedobacter sp. KBW06]
MNIPPLTLHKYIKWSDKPRNRIKDILFQNRFCFDDSITFNDPFDSKILTIFEEKYSTSEHVHLNFLRIDTLLSKINYTEDEMRRKAKEYHLNPVRSIYDTRKMTQSIHESIFSRPNPLKFKMDIIPITKI